MASGHSPWDPAILNFAIQELRREFPTTPADRIVQAVGMAARTVEPAVGRVVLLQRARESLG